MCEQSQDKWYGVAVTFKAVHKTGASRRRNLWERTFLLVRAQNEESAAQIAADIARKKELEYVAVGGDVVRWVFQEIEGICELFDEEIQPGTEVYWQHYERVDRK